MLIVSRKYRSTLFYHTSAPVNHHVSIIPCRSLQHIEVGTYLEEEKGGTAVFILSRFDSLWTRLLKVR